MRQTITIEDAYLKLLEYTDRNSTNDNFAVDKERFITAVRTAEIRYLEFLLQSRNDDEIRYAEKFLETKSISQKEKVDNYYLFPLPSNFFDHSNATFVAKKGKCTASLDGIEIKSENQPLLMNDYGWKPSFSWRETLYYLSNNNVKVFYTDFEIQSLKLTYYRYPTPPDIQRNGIASTNRDFEWDDKSIERILLGAAKIINYNAEELEKFNFDNLLIRQKI